MADVYGSAGQNRFSIPNQVGFFSVEVNKQSGVSQLYLQGPFATQQSVGTYNPSTKKFTPDPNSNLTQQQITRISSKEGIDAIRGASVTTAAKGIESTGASPQEAQTAANRLISGNVSTSNPESGDAATNPSTPSPFRPGATDGYTNLRYPTSLSTDQDCIKFSIVEYLPPGTGATSNQPRVVTMNGGNPSMGGRNILGTITLPIPRGIVDSNGVTWADDSLSGIAGIAADLGLSAIDDGGAGAEPSLGRNLPGATEGPGLENIIKTKLIGAVVGSNRLMQRALGEISNPNLELLFDNPTLRDFTFNFRFTPRTPDEARVVRSIIKSFKRAMSVKRSVSSLILKSPHTFAISYVTSNQQHPYLNKFKECALTNCSVNYTPDGTYMTYGGGVDDRSMTAYEMQLTFKELEPLFDDEYKPNENNIGF